MRTVLEARGIVYRSGRRTLIDRVDFRIEQGCFTIIVGPNGAGKSTLLRILCGELSPTAGDVLFNGQPLHATPAWKLAHCRAVMPQASELNLPFTAFEVTRLGVQGLGQGLSQSDRDRFSFEALAQADVLDLAQRDYQTLSGGERQRVHFARVLAQLKAGRTLAQPQVLFLDEPIASLDLKHQLALLTEARRLATNGLAVVAILHDLPLAAEVADDLAMLHDGRLVARGRPDERLTAARLEAIFGVTLANGVLPPSTLEARLTGSPSASVGHPLKSDMLCVMPTDAEILQTLFHTALEAALPDGKFDGRLPATSKRPHDRGWSRQGVRAHGSGVRGCLAAGLAAPVKGWW